MKKITFFLFLFVSISVYSQNYRAYYKLIDSAYYNYIIGNTIIADSVYNLAFASFVGFESDYGNAALNIFQKDSVQAYKYLAQAFKTVAKYRDVEFFLKKRGIFCDLKSYIYNCQLDKV